MSRTMTGQKFRLEPYPAQAKALHRTAGACRWLWNHALAYRKEAWLAAKSAGANGIACGMGYEHLCGVLTVLRHRHEWLGQVPVAPLRGVLKNLDRAFAALKDGRSSFPNFKSKAEGERISYIDFNALAVAGTYLRLPNIGWVKMRMHRPLLGAPRMATISYERGHWYVSLTVKGTFTLPNANQAAIGIDLGVEKPVALSTGEVYPLPGPTPKEERRLRWLQRVVSRRKPGSQRRHRAQARFAKLKAHVVARRRDAAHKITTKLATCHEGIVVEDLRIKNMTASAKGTVTEPGRNVAAKSGLNRSILANAPYEFRRMLEYKCERSGAKLIAVNPAYTSQTCSRCQHCAPENRESQAVFRCVKCGLTLNADHNAAINILTAGWAVSVQGGSGVTPACELRSQPRATARKRSRRRQALNASLT